MPDQGVIDELDSAKERNRSFSCFLFDVLIDMSLELRHKNAGVTEALLILGDGLSKDQGISEIRGITRAPVEWDMSTQY